MRTLLIVLVLFLCTTSRSEEPRTWTAKNGKTFEATLCYVHNKNSIVVCPNMKTIDRKKYIVVQISSLSKADCDYLLSVPFEPGTSLHNDKKIVVYRPKSISCWDVMTKGGYDVCSVETKNKYKSQLIKQKEYQCPFLTYPKEKFEEYDLLKNKKNFNFTEK